MASNERELLSTDHIYGKETSPKRIVIVYGDIGSKEWLQLHTKASELASLHRVQYVLRHYVNDRANPNPLSLSGYGVELAIKNMEYKAVDDSNVKKDSVEPDLHGFNFKLLKELHPDASDSLDAFRMHLKEIEELAPLKQWQASQRIVSEGAYNAIETLKELSQNFPTHARSIARETVSTELREAIELNQKEHLSDTGLDPGESMLFLNGISLDVDSMDMFQLLDIIKQEERISSGFLNMGLKREYLSILSGLEFADEKTKYAVDYRDAYPMASLFSLMFL
ncbi:hypothetical protein ANCDUO_22761 [Ancylostoma duodenale]|uniref:UDP-glucose:Glycoprotein Glucosyltransferase n=1 Tax=Ancylostoma duodenale TaxID=51022 RepID=A0A0C2FKA4_9BILA|nr:hypothetical protein ANCDUO_22761 [Ancylostoma duodenale]